VARGGGGESPRVAVRSGGLNGVTTAKTGVITANTEVIRGNQAFHDFWGRHNWSPKREGAENGENNGKHLGDNGKKGTDKGKLGIARLGGGKIAVRPGRR